MRLRKTLAAAMLMTALAFSVSLLTATAAQAYKDGINSSSGLCHTIDVDKDKGVITGQHRCAAGPAIFAKPQDKATPPKGSYR